MTGRGRKRLIRPGLVLFGDSYPVNYVEDIKRLIDKLKPFRTPVSKAKRSR